VLVEASQLPDKKDVVEVIKKMEGLAAPTEEEMERARALADLELRLLTAEVAEKEAQAAERQANAQRYQAQAGAELQKPEVEKLRIGTEARTKMEGMGMQYQSNQEDLMTRIRIAQGKEGTMRDIAKIESMTRRNEAGMKRAASLQDSLMTIRDKARDRAAGAAEKAAKKE
jgi:hypothetical protein